MTYLDNKFAPRVLENLARKIATVKSLVATRTHVWKGNVVQRTAQERIVIKSIVVDNHVQNVVSVRNVLMKIAASSMSPQYLF